MAEQSNVTKHLPGGTKVIVITPSEVPVWSEWDDDHGRLSPPVKKRLQSRFFAGDKRITAEVCYIGSESVREELRRKGRCKVKIRESSGATLVITADANNLKKR